MTTCMDGHPPAALLHTRRCIQIRHSGPRRRWAATHAIWHGRLKFCFPVTNFSGTRLAEIQHDTVHNDSPQYLRRSRCDVSKPDKGKPVRKEGTQSFWPKSREGTRQQGCQVKVRALHAAYRRGEHCGPTFGISGPHYAKGRGGGSPSRCVTFPSGLLPLDQAIAIRDT